MIRRLLFAFGAVAIAAAPVGLSRAEEPATAPVMTAASPAEEPASDPSAERTGNAASEETPASEQPAVGVLSSQETESVAADKPEATQDSAAADAARPSAEEEASEGAAASATERADAKSDGTPQAEAPETIEKPAAESSSTASNVPAGASTEALRQAISSLPSGTSDEERNERAALAAFYESRGFAPLWLTPASGFNAKAIAIAGEIGRAKEWGLDPRDFSLPAAIGSESAAAASADEAAAAEVKISIAVLTYGRYARGGRIINPSEQLSSYLDRRPQLLKPQTILEDVAAAGEPDAYLRGLNPKNPQFERLRQKYLALLAHNKAQSAEAKKLLANMEEWRWMPDDLGEVYVWNNIPEFTQRVMKDGAVLRKAAIVTGETDKQTPIFSRQLRKITFRPTWTVPDSIKVRELLPNLMRGGSLMTQWGLEVLRDGEPVNWRKIDWAETDIRNYEVIQVNGPKSVMGKVKFSFPSQHTVFMHDALERDKWMFHAARRTYSHGCMRVQNPVELAEVLLQEDKGWDAAKVRESLSTGGNNNEIPIDHKIMVHMTYFTALVDDDGKLHTFPDVYGHERRITLALEGKWNRIEKGRNHLAPVELDEAHVHSRTRDYAADEDPYESRVWRRGSPYSYGGSFLDSLFGGGNTYGPSQQYGQYPVYARRYR